MDFAAGADKLLLGEVASFLAQNRLLSINGYLMVVALDYSNPS